MDDKHFERMDKGVDALGNMLKNIGAFLLILIASPFLLFVYLIGWSSEKLVERKEHKKLGIVRTNK